MCHWKFCGHWRVHASLHSSVDSCTAQTLPVTMSFLFGKGSKVAKVSDLVKAIKDALATMEKNSKGNEKVRLPHLREMDRKFGDTDIRSVVGPIGLETRLKGRPGVWVAFLLRFLAMHTALRL